MIKNSLLLFVIIIASSCSKSFDTQEEMSVYLTDQENGYCYKKNVNGVDYTLEYRPTDLLVKQELPEKHTSKEIEALRTKYCKYLYFNLSMSMNNKELLSNVVRDKNQFGQMVNDLAFGMDQKVHLYTPEKDTLALVDFIYPRMYGMSKTTTLMIVYPRDEKYLCEKYLNFVVQDLGLYTGDIKFKIQTKPLQNEPRLRF